MIVCIHTYIYIQIYTYYRGYEATVMIADDSDSDWRPNTSGYIDDVHGFNFVDYNGNPAT